MQCRNCGTEIADKAIVCYRCGTGTTDPVRKPVAIVPRRNPLLSLLVAAVLVLLALYMGYAAQTATEPDRWRAAAGVLIGAALMIVVLRLLWRRR
jgi:peptidoglycan/LPS O-acetylase OafA/YrhL